jgi:acyl-CoA synthetase (AMP-forming)/AMP-acid ligase II
MRNVSLYGTDPAVVYRGERLSWSGLAERAFRAANALLGEGVRRGDRIGVLQANSPEIFELAFAAALVGAAVVPISPLSVTAEVRYITADAGLRLAFAEDQHPAAPGFGSTPVVRTGHRDYAAFRDAASPLEPEQREQPGDAVLQLYTSGTTGRPKGVVLSQQAMIQNGLSVQLSQRLRHEDVYLTATPLAHAGSGTRIFSLAIDGMCQVILRKFSPDAFFDAIEQQRVTTTLLVPTMLRAILDSPRLDTADLTSLRFIVYGAAPTALDLITEACQRLPCGLLQGYGLTEGNPALTVLTPEEHRRFAADRRLQARLTSAGRPVPGTRFRVANPDAEPPGVGELQVRSTKAMTEYWRDPDRTRAAFPDGWLATGDLGWIDDDGFVYIVDRQKDMLISGGLNVYPSEIERVLRAVPNVRDVAVVGVPHDHWGETPVAYVVDDGDDEMPALLRQACDDQLARYKRPNRIVRVGSLPRTETGKVMKRSLREQAIADAGA